MRKQKLIWNLRDGSQSQACTIRELKINVHTERNIYDRENHAIRVVIKHQEFTLTF